MKQIFNGRYSIDKNGVIISNITKDSSTGKAKVIKPHYDKDGYKRLALVTDEGRKKFRVGRLVALTFIENPENKEFVNHIDGDKQNDSVENLEWVTASENTQHAFNNGLMSNIIYDYEIYKEDILIAKANTYKECAKIISCGYSSVTNAVNKGAKIFGKYTILQFDK